MARVVLLVVCALVAPACHDETRPPARLVDGRLAPVLPVTLDGVAGPIVGTSTRVIDGHRLARDRAVAPCDGSIGTRHRRSPALLRVGTTGQSLTLRVSDGRALLACDGVRGGTGSSRWCGRAYGRLRRGRLPDPRLDLTCTGGADTPIAFAWIEPMRRARYVTVAQHGYTEAYEILAGLPVRVTSQDVDLARSGATFRVSEHDGRGRLLRRYSVQTTVAG